MKTFTFAGGILGLITFLAVGLLPSLVYGGFAGVALAGAIFQIPLGAELLPRALIAFGMVAGLLSTAGIFTVTGAALGAGVFKLASKAATLDTVHDLA